MWFEPNAYSWEGLCMLSLSRSYVVQVECVIMGRFVVCVDLIICSGQGRNIVYFDQKHMAGNRYVHWK